MDLYLIRVGKLIPLIIDSYKRNQVEQIRAHRFINGFFVSLREKCFALR